MVGEITKPTQTKGQPPSKGNPNTATPKGEKYFTDIYGNQVYVGSDVSAADLLVAINAGGGAGNFTSIDKFAIAQQANGPNAGTPISEYGGPPGTFPPGSGPTPIIPASYTAAVQGFPTATYYPVTKAPTPLGVVTPIQQPTGHPVFMARTAR